MSPGMESDVNYRSQTYGIACALQCCGGCARPTPVVGLVLPRGHETLEIDTDAQGVEVDVWEAAEAGAFVFFVEHLPEAVQRRLLELSQYYRRDGQSEQSYWLNHCSFCGMPQGDFELYCEPEGAFFPISERAAASVQLQNVTEPFEAQAAGYAYAPEFFAGVR
jgi:recombinational DNA repair protein (RecF pathway)